MKHILIILFLIVVSDFISQVPTTGILTCIECDRGVNLDKIPIPGLDSSYNYLCNIKSDSVSDDRLYTFKKSKLGIIKNCVYQIKITDGKDEKTFIIVKNKHETLNLINQLNEQFQTPTYKILNKGTDHDWNKIINNQNIHISLRLSDKFKGATCIISNK